MKRNWWLILILIVLLVITFPFVFKKKSPQVIIGNKIFNVELAEKPEAIQKGLMGRPSLAPDAGMLFIFGRADIYPFWMKNTLIPLDIIWINASTSLSTGKIVEVTTLQPPADNNNPLTYTPKEKANYVLELNANSGFKVGDEVKIRY